MENTKASNVTSLQQHLRHFLGPGWVLLEEHQKSIQSSIIVSSLFSYFGTSFHKEAETHVVPVDLGAEHLSSHLHIPLTTNIELFISTKLVRQGPRHPSIRVAIDYKIVRTTSRTNSFQCGVGVQYRQQLLFQELVCSLGKYAAWISEDVPTNNTEISNKWMLCN